MQAGVAERLEVVVAVRRAVGVVARAVVAGQAVVVGRAIATLGVVAVAEAGVQLVFHGQLWDSFYRVLGTRCHQSAQNFLSVALSTFQPNCLFSFFFLFSLHYCPAVMSVNNADANFFVFL